MSYSIRTISKAEQDIASAIEWYLEISKDLAIRFNQELDEIFSKLLAFPEAYPIVFLDMRMYLMKTYPYKILYVIDGSEIIIHAVVHHKMHPNSWQRNR